MGICCAHIGPKDIFYFVTPRLYYYPDTSLKSKYCLHAKISRVSERLSILR